MIASAIDLRNKLKLDADFFVSDAQQLPFDDNSFDLLITRNLTWSYQIWKMRIMNGIEY